MMQAFTVNEAPPAPPRDDRVVDLVRLSRNTLGDRSLEREVLQLFVRQATLLLAQIATAEPARAEALAHTLKGSAQGVGAVRVTAAAEALEEAAHASPRAIAAALERLRAAVAEASQTIEGLLAAD